jgi:hypothetical protein
MSLSTRSPWQLHLAYPSARIRLETRPRRGVRLDLLAVISGSRVAVEFKYLLRRLTVVETFVAEGLADVGSAGATTAPFRCSATGRSGTSSSP